APDHSHAPSGRSPGFVTASTGFRKPGLYRLWFQVQRQGRGITIPYTFRGLPASGSTPSKVRGSEEADRGRVSSSGFSPSRVMLAAGKPAIVAFERVDAQNCSSAVVLPELGIRRELPPGETTLVSIPANGPRELHFACGMGMFRGALVVR